MDESDVEEAEWRGESEGETAADSESVTVVEVTVRLSAGFCLGRAEVETDAIVKKRRGFTADNRQKSQEVEDAEEELSKKKRKGGGREKRGLRRPRGAEVLKCVPFNCTGKGTFTLRRGCLLGKRFVGAWSLEKGQVPAVLTVLYLLAAAGGTTDKQPKTSGLSAQRQHKAENAAKAGNTVHTRWNDNGNETDRSIHSLLLCSTIQFTASCLWQKDRQSQREHNNMVPQRKFTLNYF